jgi:hypothetical protein
MTELKEVTAVDTWSLLADPRVSGTPAPIMSSVERLETGVSIAVEGVFLSASQMASLSSLLRHVGAITAQRREAQAVVRAERGVWVFLVFLSATTGSILGASIEGVSWMTPFMASAYCFGVVVLVATVLVWSRSASPPAEPSGRRR